MIMRALSATKIYRLSNKLFRAKFKRLAYFFQCINRIINNSHIPASAEIGEKSEFAYGGIGIVIHHNAKIGKNCIIGQNTTIGGRKNHGGVPKIGNNVYISAGARVIGGIIIGDNSIIGANAVVIKDVPENSVVAGVPAKVIKINNLDYIEAIKS
ncbi:serine O-acetyltransferase [Clostridium sp. LP20]|uniref:serine O-acetyltransferase n=1 Tax=Clostridium sp. LP20 TaxID=3418665 RepID=UPI003EE6307F